jgi:histidine triad (HIT) family protein
VDVSCVFCAIAQREVDAHFVLEEEAFVAFLDQKPLFFGHVLVVPRAHLVTLSDVPEALLAPLFGAVQRLARAVESAMGAEGTFVAMNNTVSQSVPHLHVHVVPRKKGDGLRGFFWPRTKYPSDVEAREVAAKISAALERARSADR